MARSLLTLPVTAVKIGAKVARKLAWPALAVSLVVKAMQRPAAAPAEPTPAPVQVREPQPVVDPVPLAEAAVDLDVEVTLASELPIRAYDALAAADAELAIRELTDAEEVRAVLHFEEENAKRADVLDVARDRLATLSQAARR